MGTLLSGLSGLLPQILRAHHNTFAVHAHCQHGTRGRSNNSGFVTLPIKIVKIAGGTDDKLFDLAFGHIAACP
jgi:hypothetical protein